MQTSLTAKLVGVSFRPIEAQAAFIDLKVGADIGLERDADNPHDSNAVGLISNEIMIGYVDRESAAAVAGYLDSGYSGSARLLSKHKRGGQVQINLWKDAIPAIEDTPFGDD